MQVRKRGRRTQAVIGDCDGFSVKSPGFNSTFKIPWAAAGSFTIAGTCRVFYCEVKCRLAGRVRLRMVRSVGKLRTA